MHLILFDVDGTLIRGHGMGRVALERAFAEVHAVPAEDHPAVRAVPFAGQADPVIVAGMARALGVADPLFRARMAELEAAYVRHLRRTVAEAEGKAACPGVAELLERLDARPDVVTGLVTGNIEAGARIKLEAFGFNRYFPFGGFGGDGEERAVLVERARERAEAYAGAPFAPGDVLVVGDTVHDVAAGLARGYLTAGVATGSTPARELLQAGAHAAFEDLTPEGGFENWLAARWGRPAGAGSI